jgi:serine phosphatase RsbU (regulator of sigma subunit)
VTRAPARGGAGSGSGRTGERGQAAKQNHSDPLSSLGSSLPVPLPVPDWSKPIILALVLLAVALGVRWRVATRRARRLERRQGTLLRDIKAMQAALVPEVPERLAGLGLSVAYRPAEGPAAGGDFYDAFALDPGRVAMILGDVAGHGHEALRQAALARYTLRAFLKETGDPRAALALAGHALSEPGMEQLATVAIAVFDAERGTLTYALAGHPPPLLIDVPVEDAPAACSSPPLGCEIATGRRQRTIGMPAGSRACFFSDGLIEARRSVSPPGGHPDLLGRERLAELLAALPAGAGAEQLLAAVREEAAATPDDMAACILTCRSRGSRRVLDIEELEVERHAVDAGHLAAYLDAAGLGAAEAARAQRSVEAQLDSHDTAVLLLDRSGGGEIEVGVRAGGERLSGAAELRRVEPGATRLMRA